MSFVLLGILNSQAAGGGLDSDFDWLETTIVTSNTSTVSFTNLQSAYGADYQDLVVHSLMRTNRADYQDKLQIRFNYDSGSNYSSHDFGAKANSFEGGQHTNFTRIATQNWTAFSTNESNSNMFGSSRLELVQFANTNAQGALLWTSTALGGTQVHSAGFTDATYEINSNIDSLQLSSENGAQWTAGTRFSLYGRKVTN